MVINMKPTSKIGVIDTGVGGLTVLGELVKVFPNEDFIYYGDSANCPYGNRDTEDILELTKAMLRYMEREGVKIVIVACNTISAIIDLYKDLFPFEIISIIDPVCKVLATEENPKIGITATHFTINSGSYDKILKTYKKNIEIIGSGSSHLADYVDRGDVEEALINKEIKEVVGAILEKSPDITQVVLACTHFPIILKNFTNTFPQINFRNPASYQAMAVKDYLKSHSLENPQIKGNVIIHSSGETHQYKAVCSKLGIDNVVEFKQIV